MYYSDKEAKQLICEYGKRIYEQHMVVGNEGNLSVRTGENEIWITPTCVSKGYLTPEMLLKIDLEGNILIQGDRPLTSEAKMHCGIFKESKEICAVIHTHAVFATAFACSHKRVNTRMLPELLGLFGEEIKVAPYGRPGTYELPEAIRPFVKENRAVLLENHGAATWAETMEQAFYNMEFLEKCCKVYALANFVIGDAHDIPNELSINEQLDAFKDGMGR